MRAARRVVLRLALGVLALGTGGVLGGGEAGADEKGTLPGIEAEFKAAIKKVTPATVLCIGKGAPPEQRARGGSSGVIVSKKGLVLSDADATALLKITGTGDQRREERTDSAQVEVRVPDLRSGTFKSYVATVVLKSREADTCLLRVTDPPAGGFPAWVTMGSSDDLAVGDFTFAMGNSFGLSDEALPSLTAGVVSALEPLAPGHAEGRWEFLYTSAGVNPGVNGGPLVDIEGRLVGTVSTFVLPVAADPYQYLGKVIPVQRLRAIYGHLPEAAELFPEGKPVKARSAQAAALEATFHQAALAAAPGVASLVVERSTPFIVMTPVGGRALLPMPRYSGPVSAVVASAEGELVTSLYNLTNTFTLVNPPDPQEPLPAPLALESGLATIQKITACFADGRQLPAKLVGTDPRLGVALLKVEQDEQARYAPPLLVPAPAQGFQEGRFALALGNPYGTRRRDEPLLSVGILSKVHAATAPWPWRGDWQTDAGVTDANCGGAAVDLQGRLYGVLQLWAPLMHGRASGIGFVIPWARVEAALPDMRAGRVWRRGFMGIAWKRDVNPPEIEEVTAGSAAARAGLKAGDRFKSLDGEPIDDIADARQQLRYRWEGETVRVVVVRAGPKKPVEVELEVTLGARPEAPKPTPETPAPAEAPKPSETPEAPKPPATPEGEPKPPDAPKPPG